jgi:hypothetical protein
MPAPRKKLPEDFQERRMRQIARAVAQGIDPPGRVPEEMMVDLVWECRHYSRGAHAAPDRSSYARCAALDFSFTVRFAAAVLDRFEGRTRLSRVERIADALLDRRIFDEIRPMEHWMWQGTRGEERAAAAAAFERLSRKNSPGYVDSRRPRKEDRGEKDLKQVADMESLRRVIGFRPTHGEIGDALALLRIE